MSKKDNRFISDLAQGTVLAAKSENQVAEIIDDLILFKKIIESEPDVARLLSNPSLTLENRRSALNKAVGSEMHELSIKAVLLLIENHALGMFNDFYEMLIKYAKEMSNYHLCVVTSAIEVKNEQKNEIKKSLEKKFKGTVRIDYEIDPSVIGGLAINCGDWRYLGTVQAKLQQLSRHLITS